MRFLLVFVLLVTLPLTVGATDYRGDCDIVFQGSSTLHGFHGKARCQPFTVNIIDGIIDSSKLNVAIADMDTDNGKRDKNMREMFEEKKYPLITGSAAAVALKDIRTSQKSGSDSLHKISFKLKIRDVVKPVTATVKNFVETDSRITSDVAFTLSLADYQLQPPSVLGMIKVDDKVSVTATFILNATK
ncbi:MAG: YceI family protein [Desulfuromonadaceae bacterium]